MPLSGIFELQETSQPVLYPKNFQKDSDKYIQNQLSIRPNNILDFHLIM